MGVEIERKFLVRDDAWRSDVTATKTLRQGYLSLDPEAVVRVRTDGHQGWLTIKGRSTGISRAEFEYPVPSADADALLALCGGRVVEKVRHLVPHGAHTWEVDVFSGANTGLIVAEIELSSDTEPFDRPGWLGEEVSGDRRYDNASLAVQPWGGA